VFPGGNPQTSETRNKKRLIRVEKYAGKKGELEKVLVKKWGFWRNLKWITSSKNSGL